MVEASIGTNFSQRLFDLGQELVKLALDIHPINIDAAKSDLSAAVHRSAFSFGPETQHSNASHLTTMAKRSRPPLPDPRLIRRIIRQRQHRARFFDGDLFADPAWDMLLDLTAARAEHVRVAVTSLCIASCVPPTTALRWIGQMVDAGLLERVEDATDRRRSFIQLSDRAVEKMAQYFHELGEHAGRAI